MLPFSVSIVSCIIVFLAGLFCIPQQVLASQRRGFSSKATPLTLKKAIQKALNKNPIVSAVNSQLDASVSRVTRACSGLLPQLNFSENFTRTESPASVFSAKLNQGYLVSRTFM